MLRQLVHDEGHRFPRASGVLLRSTYVDDVLTGTDDLDAAFQLRDELIKLLKAGGFRLRKWVSNHPEFIEEIPRDERLRPNWEDFMNDEPVKTLGIAWMNFVPACQRFQIASPRRGQHFPLWRSYLTLLVGSVR